MKKWLIVIKVIVYPIIAVCYFVFRGPELAYAIYIPLDILLEIAQLLYRIMERYLLNQEIERNRKRE